MNFTEGWKRRIYEGKICDLKRIFKNCSMNANWSCRLNQPVRKSEDFYKQCERWLQMRREFRYIGWNGDDIERIDTGRYLNERKSTEPLDSLSERQWSVYKSNRLYKRRE